MTILEEPNRDDRILTYDKAALRPELTKELPTEALFTLVRLKEGLGLVFQEAREKITISNKQQLLDELEEFTNLLFDSFYVTQRKSNELIGSLIVRDFPKNPPSEAQLEPLRRKYGKGSMCWGKTDFGNPILMLRLEDSEEWLPHTNAYWDELFQYADRQMSKEVTSFGPLSDGIGEFQFLIKYMGWNVVSA